MTATRAWKLAPVRMCCGHCGNDIAKKERFLEIRLPGIKRVRNRCATCAATVYREREDTTPTFTRFGLTESELNDL